MKPKENIAVLTTITGFVIGAALNAFFQVGLTFPVLGMHPFLDMIILIIAVFALSAMFFGRFTALVFAFFGAVLGEALAISLNTGLITLLQLLPISIAGIAGLIAGMRAEDDLQGIDNLFRSRSLTFALLGAFIAGIITVTLAEYLTLQPLI
jgi:hypothetical protein